MSKKPKVLWVSDLVTPTGFSRVSHSIIAGLVKDFDIVGLGINYRGDPHQYSFPIYPASIGGRIFGEDRLTNILNNAEFDILYILNDAWVIDLYLSVIKRDVKKKLPKIVVYFPVDSEGHDPSWYRNFDIVSEAVTYTEFGRAVVNNETCAPGLQLNVIPHGVDSKVFYQKYTNRRDAKKALFGDTKDPDSFIFLNANRNQPRKRLDITMEAFKLFADGRDDAFLYMHSGVVDSHIDIAKMSVRLGIDSKLILTNLNRGVQTVPDGTLNDIYNACDVGLNTGMGEGWGLTSVEHAMCGAVQIVPDHSACSELFIDCGLLVKPITNFTFDRSMTVGKLISPEALAEKMELIYSDSDLRADLSKRAIDKFSKAEYTWSNISKQWKEVFTRVLSYDNTEVSENN